MRCTTAVEWVVGNAWGQVDVMRGRVGAIEVVAGNATVNEDRFASTGDEPPCLRLALNVTRARSGFDNTIVTVAADDHPPSFFARDVSAEFPLFIEDYGVAVFPGDSPRRRLRE